MHNSLLPRSRKIWPAWWLATLSLCIVSACDTADPAAQAGTVQGAGKPPITVSQESEGRATVGSIGGSIRLSDRVGAVYSIALRDEGAWLEGAALLRGSARGWYNTGANEVPLSLNNLGVGGSLGKHMVVVSPKADGLWLDDKLYVPLSQGNVVLFDGADAELKRVGSAAIDAYLGPAPLDDAKQRKALVQERLRAILVGSADIRAQWPAD